MNISTQIADLKDALAAIPARAAALVDAIRDKQQELDRAQHSALDETELDARIAAIVERTARGYLHDHGGKLLALGRRSGRRRTLILPEHPRTGETQLGTWGAQCAADPAGAAAHLRRLVIAAGWTPGVDAAVADREIARLEREVRALEDSHAALVDEAQAAGIDLKHLPATNLRREREAHDARQADAARDAQQQLDAAATPDAGRVMRDSPYLAQSRAETDALRRAVDGVAR